MVVKLFIMRLIVNLQSIDTGSTYYNYYQCCFLDYGAFTSDKPEKKNLLHLVWQFTSIYHKHCIFEIKK